jgi:hypothetical protein
MCPRIGKRRAAYWNREGAKSAKETGTMTMFRLLQDKLIFFATFAPSR